MENTPTLKEFLKIGKKKKTKTSNFFRFAFRTNPRNIKKPISFKKFQVKTLNISKNKYFKN
jgi:hypothetical protein